MVSTNQQKKTNLIMKNTILGVFLLLSLVANAQTKPTSQKTIVNKGVVKKKDTTTKTCCTAAIPNRFGVKPSSKFTVLKQEIRPFVGLKVNTGGMVGNIRAAR